MSPTHFRIFALGAQAVAAVIAVVIFKPSKKELKCAFFAGMICSVYDFIIEAVAYRYGVWYCYGGFQVLHVPLDMSLQFILYGIMVCLISGFPVLFRKWNFMKIFYRNPKHDSVHKALFVILISLWGATGDFISKKFGVWENAAWWTFYHTAAAWLSLNALTVFSYTQICRLTGAEQYRLQ